MKKLNSGPVIYIFIFCVFICSSEISYYVEAYTGDMDEAGTEANVFIQLYGDKGDSGPRRLLHSKTNDNKFEKGKVILTFNMNLFIPL